MSVPTREEIKARYGIKEDDFAILERSDIPSAAEALREARALKKLGFWGRFEVWAETSVIGGILMAILFVEGVIGSVDRLYNYGAIIYAHSEQIAEYRNHFADYAKLKAIGFLAHTNSGPTSEDIEKNHWVIFPTGTALYPISGNWLPG